MHVSRVFKPFKMVQTVHRLILVPIALFSSLSRRSLDEKRAMGTRMCIDSLTKFPMTSVTKERALKINEKVVFSYVY